MSESKAKETEDKAKKVKNEYDQIKERTWRGIGYCDTLTWGYSYLYGLSVKCMCNKLIGNEWSNKCWEHRHQFKDDLLK